MLSRLDILLQISVIGLKASLEKVLIVCMGFGI